MYAELVPHFGANETVITNHSAMCGPCATLLGKITDIEAEPTRVSIGRHSSQEGRIAGILSHVENHARVDDDE